jgi:hypothetical protein
MIELANNSDSDCLEYDYAICYFCIGEAACDIEHITDEAAIPLSLRTATLQTKRGRSHVGRGVGPTIIATPAR